MPEKTVVMIDHDIEIAPCSLYAKELAEHAKGRFVVRKFTDVDTAWEFLLEHRAETACVVTEILMLPGQLFKHQKEELEDGRKTGLALCDKIRRRWPEMPVVFLSYAADRDLIAEAEDKPRSIFLEKFSTLPYHFVQALSEFLDTSTQPQVR